jgi:hypothetical protein
MEFNPYIVGAAAGIAGNELQKRIDHDDSHRENMFQALHSAITELRKELKTITDHVADSHLPPEDIVLQVQPVPWSYRLLRKERRYNMIFLPNNSTQLVFNIPGLGNFNFTPPIGWTELNFPVGTEISSGAGIVSLIYRVTNIPLGSSVI